jgi:primosomal protein N' (replication factor Y) (superfamily II helicase)
LISAKGKSLPVAELLHKIEGTKSTIDSLVKKNFVDVFEKEVERRYTEEYTEEHQQLILTTHQQKVVEEVNAVINKKEFKTFLLHGVTGSGKTQVYIELVKQVLSQNKTALILVPEISLTPQMTSRLFNNFGDTVTVIHSRMSAGERYDSWRRVMKGKSKVVVGARSALFAPLRNIGIIVVDEEHDASYKQADMIPKYNARDLLLCLEVFINVLLFLVRQHHRLKVCIMLKL